MKRRILNFSFQDHTLSMPYYQFGGSVGGPHFFLTGGMHGDEINGIAIVSHFLQWFRDTDMESSMKGTLTIVPVLNVSGFVHMKRRVFQDRLDLNRCFGSSFENTFSGNFASHLVDTIFQFCDYGIDVHDAGDRDVLVPHPRFHACDAQGCDVHTRTMAHLFDSPILIEREGNDGMLAVEMAKLFSIPVLTLEIGGNQRLCQDYFSATLQGIKNIFIDYGLFGGDVILAGRTPLVGRRRYAFRSDYPGFMHLNVGLYDKVHVGDVLGYIYFPLTQEKQEILCTVCGVVFSINVADQIRSGESLLSVLEVEERCCPVEISVHGLGCLYVDEVHM